MLIVLQGLDYINIDNTNSKSYNKSDWNMKLNLLYNYIF